MSPQTTTPDTLSPRAHKVRSPPPGSRHGAGGITPSPRDIEALLALAEHVALTGTLPTLAEVGERLGVQRTTARKRLVRAAACGLVVQPEPYVARGFRPTPAGWARIEHLNERLARTARPLVEDVMT